MQEREQEETLILRGWPSVRDFVRQIRLRASREIRCDEDLTQEWREANTYVATLPPLPSGDSAASCVRPLPASIEHEAQAEAASPLARRCFGLLPYQWRLVELDQLIAWQSYVNKGYADRLRSELSEDVTVRALFHFARGSAGQPAAQDAVKLAGPRGGNNYVFASASNDLRVLDVAPLAPAQVTGFDAYGSVASVLAVVIGFSYNCMTAIRLNNRLVLLNGTHRAYAMRAHGVTHAPCLVRDVASTPELDLARPGGPSLQPIEWYFSTARPPLLRDYFDARLVTAVRAQACSYQMHLELKFSRAAVPLP